MQVLSRKVLDIMKKLTTKASYLGWRQVQCDNKRQFCINDVRAS
jgi:hypothetical protein